MNSFIIIAYAAFFVVISISDVRHLQFRTTLLLGGFVLAFPAGWLLGTALIDAFVGMCIVVVFFGAQYIFSRGKWIGAGDILLGCMMGMLLGWEKTILALSLAYVIGALVATVLLLMKKITRRTPLPFGPFLCGATLFCMLWGDVLLSIYIL